MTIDLTNEWEKEKGEDSRFIYGVFEISKEEEIFIRKTQIPFPGTDEWATNATESWDFNTKNWVIDNTLQGNLDENDFTIYEDRREFVMTLNISQNRHDQAKENNIPRQNND